MGKNIMLPIEKMKKALIVATRLGFIALFERNDVALLQSKGYEVHLACDLDGYGNQKKVDMLMEMGTIDHDIKFTRKPFTTKNLIAYKQLKEIAKKEKFDLIHCHTPVGGVMGRMVGHACKVPFIIYSAHGFHFFKGAPIKMWVLFYPIERWMSRYSNIQVTINDEDYQLAKKKFQSDMVKRIHGVGVDISAFQSKEGQRKAKRKELGLEDGDVMLFSVGELGHDKNHMVVFEAMKELKQDCKYFIAGGGPYKEKFQDYIRQNSLEDRIILLGYRYDIAELLQAADIFIFPSLFEGLSVALMEAVAAKRPIACSEVRGNVDTVVTKESYFDPKKPEQVVKTVRRIEALTFDEKKVMTETNYRNLLKYDLKNVHQEMKEIYDIADSEIEKVRNLK